MRDTTSGPPFGAALSFGKFATVFFGGIAWARLSISKSESSRFIKTLVVDPPRIQRASLDDETELNILKRPRIQKAIARRSFQRI
jgi:hypothetical protein